MERGGVSPVAESMFCEAKLLSLLANVGDEGARTLRYEFASKLTSTCQLLKKVNVSKLPHQKLYPLRAGCRLRERSLALGMHAGRNALGAVTLQKPPRGVYRDCWESHAAALRRETAAGTARSPLISKAIPES